MTTIARFQALVGLSLLALPGLADERPNIVLIVADDVGFSDIGAYGSEIHTPNIDALAREGVQLTNYHAAPTCGPSRSMLLTGVDHHLAGSGINRAGLFRLPELRGRPGYEGYLNDSVVTFASLLNDAGYHVGHFGKWHCGRSDVSQPGCDRWFSIQKWQGAHHGAYVYRDEDKDVEIDGFKSRIVTDYAVDWIRDGHDDKP